MTSALLGGYCVFRGLGASIYVTKQHFCHLAHKQLRNYNSIAEAKCQS